MFAITTNVIARLDPTIHQFECLSLKRRDARVAPRIDIAKDRED